MLIIDDDVVVVSYDDVVADLEAVIFNDDVFVILDVVSHCCTFHQLISESSN